MRQQRILRSFEPETKHKNAPKLMPKGGQHLSEWVGKFFLIYNLSGINKNTTNIPIISQIKNKERK